MDSAFEKKLITWLKGVQPEVLPGRKIVVSPAERFFLCQHRRGKSGAKTIARSFDEVLVLLEHYFRNQLPGHTISKLNDGSYEIIVHQTELGVYRRTVSEYNFFEGLFNAYMWRMELTTKDG
jgi:hypothetical protein